MGSRTKASIKVRRKSPKLDLAARLSNLWDEVAAEWDPPDVPWIVFHRLLDHLVPLARANGVGNESMLHSLIYAAAECGGRSIPAWLHNHFRQEKWGVEHDRRLSRLLYKAASLITTGKKDAFEKSVRQAAAEGDLSYKDLLSELTVMGIEVGKDPEWDALVRRVQEVEESKLARYEAEAAGEEVAWL